MKPNPSLYIILLTMWCTAAFCSWPGLLKVDEINEEKVGETFGIKTNLDYCEIVICDSRYTTIISEPGDTSFYWRRGDLFRVKSDSLNHSGMYSFKLRRISKDTLTFTYPIPRSVRRSIGCDSSKAILSLPVENVIGCITSPGPPVAITLFSLEALTFAMSALTFWKYGDEIAGGYWIMGGSVLVTIPAIHSLVNKDINFFESAGGYSTIPISTGLIALGVLNLVYGDKYDRSKVFWGNVVAVNTSFALGFALDALVSRIKERKRWKTFRK